MSRNSGAVATVILNCTASGQHKVSRLHREHLEPVVNFAPQPSEEPTKQRMNGAVMSWSKGNNKSPRMESTIWRGGMRSPDNVKCPRCQRVYRIGAERMLRWLTIASDESPTGRVVVDLSENGSISF